MALLYKSFTILLWNRLALGTISGLSYMDPIRQRSLDSKLPGEDPCNPLYWYPKKIPEYCYLKPPVTITITEKPPLPVPLPVPVPLPIPVPPPMLMPMPQHFPGLPMPLPIMPPPPPIAPPQVFPIAPPPAFPIAPPPAFPIAVPPLHAQSPMMPIVPASPLMSYSTDLQSHYLYSYPIHEPRAGLVPGLPGLVTDNGGINIMPFSDVYADMLEKHKNKMIRKKLRRIINEYEHFPNSRKYLRLKKLKRMMNFE